MENNLLNLSGENKKRFEEYCKALDEQEIKHWFPPEVKCQKTGCGKILSAPTNHRCDLCYCYYQ